MLCLVPLGYFRVISLKVYTLLWFKQTPIRIWLCGDGPVTTYIKLMCTDTCIITGGVGVANQV